MSILLRKLPFLVLLLGLVGNLFAQSIPIRDTLSVNAIQASVQSNGAFFQGGSNGHFLVPTALGTATSTTLMKSAGLWLAGLDSVGNLKLSAQLYNENGKTDFYPGILSIDGVPDPAFNLIAGVTIDEVNEHKNNPGSMIPSIYGWPGTGNSFFANYYGFELPSDAYLAGFYDQSFNFQYNPAEGDYPALDLRGCPLKNNADEALWFAFHDVGPHTQSGAEPLNMEVQTQFFGFNCQEGSPVDRVLYVVYKLINRNPIPLDSCYFGVFLDFEIGNGADDYIGSDPLRRVAFAYNGDEVDEGGFENSAPVMAVDLLRGPFNNEPFEEVNEWHFVPVDDAALSSPAAYYNLLAGRNPDGSPLPNNGLMYTGNPLDPSAWSEISEGNTPGERKALASFGPFNLFPGAINELVLGYAWMRKHPNGSVAENLSILGATMDAVQGLYDNCFELFDGCPSGVSIKNPASEFQILVSPNPFTQWIQLESPTIPLHSVVLFDGTGRLVRDIVVRENGPIVIQTLNLPPGFYGLQVRSLDGRTANYKLIHE
jgi:hypothetical protein